MDPIVAGYLESIGLPIGVVAILAGVYYIYKTRCKDSSCLVKGKNFSIEIKPDDLDNTAENIRQAIKSSPEIKDAVIKRLKSDAELHADLHDSHDSRHPPTEV